MQVVLFKSLQHWYITNLVAKSQQKTKEAKQASSKMNPVEN